MSAMRAAGTQSRAAAVHYDPELVEEAVLLVLGGAPADVGAAARLRAAGRHQRRVDGLYRLAHGCERERAFRRHYHDLFARLGLVRRLPRLLEEHPILRRRLVRVQVRSTSTGAEPGAVLWERREERGGGIPSYLVIGLTASSLLSCDRLRHLLRTDLAEAARIVAGTADQAAGQRRRIGVSGRRRQPEPRRCPLCRYPTAVWATDKDLRSAAASIVEDFPAWSAELGLCAHCADRYTAALRRPSE